MMFGFNAPLVSPYGPEAVMQIAKHTVATLEYTLTDESGEVLDASKGREPLAYVHGVGMLIPGLEEELKGKVQGDSLKARIEPDRGYGVRDEAMVQSVPRQQLPDEVEIEVGMQFQAQSEGDVHVVTVVEVEGEEVKLDANHPLAGVTLHFDVEVKEVREATSEEIEHGHVHGPGGHDH
jgi:FKBP-type peptidyl-prolyl cis-trans isomerase SlyD